MGTRSDFYVGIGKNTEWLGSLTHNGWPFWYEIGVASHGLLDARDEASYRRLFAKMMAVEPEISVQAADGWPWPWNDSSISSWIYAFHDGEVWMCDVYRDQANKVFRPAFGSKDSEEGVIYPDDRTIPLSVPDMTDRPKQVGGTGGFLLLGQI